MAKPAYIELGPIRHPERIPIIFEDRSVLAIDKPPGWMLVPFSWQKTNRNLQAAITSSIAARDFWASSRNLKFLRFVHRLDAETSGVLLFAKSLGATHTIGDLFETRQMEKVYLAVISGVPQANEWSCDLALGQDQDQIGRMKVDAKQGKQAETHFKVLATRPDVRFGKVTLIEARPVTGRTHQIRVHLAQTAKPIIGDELYASKYRSPSKHFPLGLRAISLAYTDPFTRKRVRIAAPTEQFLAAFGFPSAKSEPENKTATNAPSKPSAP